MSATDYFLFPLSFLVLGLLAEWIRRLGRELGGLRDDPGTRTRDGELARLSDSLATALGRIEVLERRSEEVARDAPESEVSSTQWSSAMDRLGPAWGSGAGLTDPGRRTPTAEGDVTATPDPDPERSPWSSRDGAPLDDLFPPPERQRHVEEQRPDGR